MILSALKKLPRNKGFTLVELLIVISLLSVLALAVLSAINPLEQANRARDARLKTDSEQLISGIDRYFVATGEMPWVDDLGSSQPAPGYGWVSAADIGVGVCGDAACSANGDLILADELKSEFKNRDFIKTTVNQNKIWLAKGDDPSDAVYACFVPASNAERKDTTNLSSIPTSGGQPTGSMPASGVPDNCPATVTWSGDDVCYFCLPQ